MIKKGRQAAPTLDGIRDDHKRRYELAIDVAESMGARDIADIGCGTGYGSFMMAQEGFYVRAYEIDADAIEFGEQHYHHENLIRVQADLETLDIPFVDVITAFEILEHSASSMKFLDRVWRKVGTLVGSVPNERVVPFITSKHRQHVRHYTADELRDSLREVGWKVDKIGCQTGKHRSEADVRWDTTEGRTLVFVAHS